MIGAEIQSFRITEKIGEGGMATVYKAVHKTLPNMWRAIKVMHPSLALDPNIRSKFLVEAQTLASLNHQNIVRIYDFLEQAGNLILIMEFVDGESLDSLIKNKTGPIGEDRTKALFAQILEAIGYAHEKGVIHRDIKPANILVTQDDEVKIIDFGIVKILQDDDRPGATKTGTKIGTPIFMSPEQILAKSVDQRSDIYALGVTLFQMVTGKAPYDFALSEFEIQTKIVNEPLPRAKEIYPGVGSKMQFIIDKATAKKKENRYQSCKDLKAEFFTKTQEQEPQSIEHLSEFQQANNGKMEDLFVAPPKARKGRTSNIIILLVLLVFVVVAISIYYSSSSTNHENSSPNQNFAASSCNSILDKGTTFEWYISDDRNYSWQEAISWVNNLTACGGHWSLPTVEQILALYDPSKSAGIGYCDEKGRYFPAKIDPAFEKIGNGSWVWTKESVNRSDKQLAYAVNLFNGQKVIMQMNQVKYPVRVFAVRKHSETSSVQQAPSTGIQSVANNTVVNLTDTGKILTSSGNDRVVTFEEDSQNVESNEGRETKVDFDINKIKKIIIDYYNADQQNNFSIIDNLLDKSVDRFYSKAFPSHQDIFNGFEPYVKKYPIREYSIDWESFKFVIRKNILYTKLHLNYQIKKFDKDYYFKYDIVSVMHFNTNYKISFIYNEREMKIN